MEEQGLAAALAQYGKGEGQNTKHYYAGATPAVKKKKKCKKKKEHPAKGKPLLT